MPRTPKACDALEIAARHLAGWGGCGQAWFADWDEVNRRTAAGGEAFHVGAALSIRWPGRVVQAGERGWLARVGLDAKPRRGPFRLRQLRAWDRYGAKVALPSHRPGRDAAAALSYAKLPGPLAPLLLLYACEDLRLWPTVERFALACFPHPEAVSDAMQRILWGTHGRFSPPAMWKRARQLRVRTETYGQRTGRAEAMLRGWLDRAAWAFLEALNGNDGDHETSIESEGQRAPPIAPRTAPDTALA